MKMKSFRIKNYRSIKDSGICYLSGDNITILAGKNESGKTAILEALEDFGVKKTIREQAIPINNRKAKPEIIVCFEIEKEEIGEILKSVNVQLPKPVNRADVEVIKTYPNTYALTANSKESLGLKEDELIRNRQSQISGFYSQIGKIHTGLHQAFPQLVGSLPQLELKDTRQIRTQMNELRNTLQTYKAQIPAELHSNIEDLIKLTDGIIAIVTDIDNLKILDSRIIDKLRDSYIPSFILFSTFDDVFPSEILLSEATNNELIKDLEVVSDLGLDIIRSPNVAEKMRHKDQLNVRLKNEYKKYWSQDLTNLHIDWDSDKLYFFVKEGDDFYPPNLRSKGKQWHLAFYIRVSARSKENVPNIILIDEPGGYLHAQAQEDVLNKLEDSAKNAPVIFSTHSPFLIKVDNLHRIRLVLRNSEREGTIVSNKIHKSADKETLTPIITAIGLDLSRGLDIAKDNNILFEGITDYYYVGAFKELLQFQFAREVHSIPSAGADKLHLLASLMIGWGFEFCIVLDNDDKGKRTKERLEQDFKGVDIKVLFVSETTDEEIEDLFTTEDFAKYVLKKEITEVPTEMTNSQIIKKQDKGYDKVLLAKSFFELVKNGKIELSQSTKDNFGNLLQRINDIMFQENGSSNSNS